MSDDTTDIQSTATPSAEPIPSPTSELPTAPTKATPLAVPPPPPKAPMPPPIAPTPVAPMPVAPTPTPQSTGLRLRVKVWTDPKTRKRYLVPTGIMSDPVRGLITAYAMTDEDTKEVKLTPGEWNALPFFYFKEDGPAPRGDVWRDLTTSNLTK
jgi:hypothetical protein